MASFEWVPYSEEESAPASAPGAGDVEDEDIDVGEAQVTEAFRGYSDGRAREAEAIRVEKVMEEARREGARLKELMENPKAAAEYDARLAAETVEAAALAHGATAAADGGGGGGDDDDDSDDDLVEKAGEATEEDRRRVDEFLRKAEVLKLAGNGAFLKCCKADDAVRRRDLAADAAIYYLDVLDVVAAAERVRMTEDQRRALRALTLATLLNRAAALNRQDEWKLSLRATNRALKMDKGSVKGLYRRAVALSGLGRHADAEGDLRRVLAAAPENADAKRKLAAVVRLARDSTKAPPTKAPGADAPPPKPNNKNREKLPIEVAIEAERAAMKKDYDEANAAANAAHRALTPRDGNADGAPKVATKPPDTFLDPWPADKEPPHQSAPAPAFDAWALLGADGAGPKGDLEAAAEITKL
jgi:tetratricopeptide (TPR) repeat protein